MLDTKPTFRQLRAQLQAMPGKSIDMSTGNPLGPGFIDTSVGADMLAVYRTGKGIGTARAAALQLFKDRGLATSPSLDSVDNVVLGLGTTHLFNLVLKDLSERTNDSTKQRVVLVSGPTYGIFADRLPEFGFGQEVVPLFSEHEWKMNREILSATVERLKLENKEVVGFYTMNPHNPSGAISTRQDLEGIVNVLKRTNALIIDDLAYSGLEFGNTKACPLGSFREIEDRVVTLISLSKSYASPGARSGALHGSADLTGRLNLAITDGIGSVPVPSQIGFEQVVANPRAAAEFQDSRREAYKSQMEFASALVIGLRNSRLPDEKRNEYEKEVSKLMRPGMAEGLCATGLPFVRILNPREQSGFFLTLDFSEYEGLYCGDKQMRSASDINEALVQSQRVLALDASAMRMDEHYPFALRITIQTSKTNIVRTIERMHQFLADLTEEPTA